MPQTPSPTEQADRLGMAIIRGQGAQVLSLLDGGMAVDTVLEDEQQPIHMAVRFGHPKIVALLLWRKAKTDAVETMTGQQPLHLAVRAGHLDIVELLMAYGADPHAEDADGTTPMDLARQGKWALEPALRLLGQSDRGATTFAHERQPIHLAAAQGDRAQVATLVAQGANPLAMDQDQRQPLHEAARNGNPDLLQWLMTHGADAQSCTRSGVTPLHLAAFFGHAPTATMLLAHGAMVDQPTLPQTSLFQYPAFPDEDILKPLFYADDYGWTALQLAVMRGHPAVAQVLLKAGADVGGDQANPPLHLAAMGGCGELTAVLLRHGANANAANAHGTQALHHAAQTGRPDLVAQLLDHGAEVDAKDRQGRQPLHDAAECNAVEVARLLLGRGAAVNARDHAGETPLMTAREHGRTAMAQFLIEHGGTE